MDAAHERAREEQIKADLDEWRRCSDKNGIWVQTNNRLSSGSCAQRMP